MGISRTSSVNARSPTCSKSGDTWPRSVRRQYAPLQPAATPQPDDHRYRSRIPSRSAADSSTLIERYQAPALTCDRTRKDVNGTAWARNAAAKKAACTLPSASRPKAIAPRRDVTTMTVRAQRLRLPNTSHSRNRRQRTKIRHYPRCPCRNPSVQPEPPKPRPTPPPLPSTACLSPSALGEAGVPTSMASSPGVQVDVMSPWVADSGRFTSVQGVTEGSGAAVGFVGRGPWCVEDDPVAERVGHGYVFTPRLAFQADAQRVDRAVGEFTL